MPWPELLTLLLLLLVLVLALILLVMLLARRAAPSLSPDALQGLERNQRAEAAALRQELLAQLGQFQGALLTQGQRRGAHAERADRFLPRAAGHAAAAAGAGPERGARGA
jgi:hypothetical protein